MIVRKNMKCCTLLMARKVGPRFGVAAGRQIAINRVSCKSSIRGELKASFISISHMTVVLWAIQLLTATPRRGPIDTYVSAIVFQADINDFLLTGY